MFNPVCTDLNAFKLRKILYGSEIVRERRNTNTESGGFIDVLEKSGIEMVPSICGHGNACRFGY